MIVYTVTFVTPRNPDASSRPTFMEVLHALFACEDNRQSWTADEDETVHTQATVLGAPLEAGNDLYPELQQTYVK